MYMQLADVATQQLINQSVSEGPILAEWEGQEIDYRLLSLYEERRWKNLTHAIVEARAERETSGAPVSREISPRDLSTETSAIGDALFYAPSTVVQADPSFVLTHTTSQNLSRTGNALLEEMPMLLLGPSSSGKTTLAHEAARRLNKLSTMITLPLNNQADAKSLLGLYITSPSGDGFIWKPGVLTQAVREGRWVLIEDLDRVPSEILSLLNQLIESRHLNIPSRNESIRASSGFRLIGTIRLSPKRSARATTKQSFLGARRWRHVHINAITISDLHQIIQVKYPRVRRHLTSVLNIFSRLEEMYGFNGGARESGLSGVIRWCHRMHVRLDSAGVATDRGVISEDMYDYILLDCIDCIAGSLSPGKERAKIVAMLAEELHCSPERLKFLVEDRIANFSNKKNQFSIGRTNLNKVHDPTRYSLNDHPFARTRHSLALIESVASAIDNAEPLLLVGETGIGKTFVIQQLAAFTGQKLTVINLSQQSEASDLIGSFKPISIRSLVLPIAEAFYPLFDQTFSARRNQSFLNSIRKALIKENWHRLLLLWEEAVKMAENAMQKKLEARHSTLPASTESNKRRKVDTQSKQRLRDRWKNLATQIRDLQNQLSRREENFAFAFTEGKLVNALRNGEWILLDEVNLAAPETLEIISSIFKPGDSTRPSLLLAEAGSTEQILSHPNFRVFAAMNPATDVGKKELMPAIRSRFTELFVEPPDRTIHEIISLIKTYIGPLAASDQRAMSDLALLYHETKRLALEGKLADGVGLQVHYSIRSLARTLLYIAQHASVYGLRRAIFEGFSMAFLTILNQESEHVLASLLDRHILGQYRNVRSSMNQAPKCPNDGQKYIQFRHYWVQKGGSETVEQPHYVLTTFIQKNLLNLARAASMKRFPILLQGPTSSGKTSMIQYLANISGNKFVRINNHEHTDVHEYLGSYSSDLDGRLYYKDGILVDALRHGNWIVLDELNLAPTDVLEALNRLLDDNRELLIPETQELVKPHPNFMLFATQNPAGLYGGRKHLSRAFRNRFLEIHIDDIPEDELECILTQRSQIPPSFASRILSVYKKLSLLRQTDRLFEQSHSFATLRDLFRWALRSADDKKQLAINGYMLLAERVRDEVGKLAIKNVIEDEFRILIDPKMLYNDEKATDAVDEDLQSFVWTPAMRRMYVLITAAFDNSEPVLLVGDTGCGKTQLCQVLAKVHDKKLHTLNAHVNTEASDLLGAQRPIRDRHVIEQQLRTDITRLCEKTGAQSPPSDCNVEELVMCFKALQSSALQLADSETLIRIKANITRANSLFEWNDGTLVQAMKTGSYFLFDEISLADDSVLERLNSVLEPSRTLVLAEKGVADAEVIATPGFQFLATMNPGGDFGKRELSAALRNRLTEIWVPPLHHDEDIVPVVQGNFTRGHPSLGQVMVDFAKWFRTSISSPLSGSVSLRDLLSWINFVNCEKQLDLPTAIIQGALLVFVDSLGAHPTGVSAMIADTVLETQQKCITYLSRLLGQDLSLGLQQTFSLNIASDNISLGLFSFPRSPLAKSETGLVFETPTTSRNMMRLLRGLRLPKPILMEGSPGVGKTAIVTALAELVGKSLTRINLSDQTDLMDLFGSDVPVEDADIGRFAWRDGPFLQAMQSGGWIILDEMNLASQSVLEGLNSCIDHRQEVYISELDRTFVRHPDFVLFATQNPHHQGGGRKGLPESFVNRFTVVFADHFNHQDLEVIARKTFPTALMDDTSEILDFVTAWNSDLQKRSATSDPILELNVRDVLRWLSLCQAASFALRPQSFLNTIVKQKLRNPIQKEEAESTWSRISRKDTNDQCYFHNLGLDYFQVGQGFLQREPLFQHLIPPSSVISKKHLPSLESLILSINHNWPTILVGSSGSGKTLLIETLAAISGAQLMSFALSRDTDSSDLIGGFEQLDYSRLISGHLEDMRHTARKEFAASITASSDESVIYWSKLYGTLTRVADVELLLKELESHIQENPIVRKFWKTLNQLVGDKESAAKAKFHWVDGQLVEAIENGNWVVLDNANLCSASVLDRLNSLLEFNGHLAINEQHTADGNSRIIRPHRNFRVFLTMDPRNGELSRAIRNRSIEVYINPIPGHQADLCTPTYLHEASIYRMRNIDQVQWQELPGDLRLSVSDRFLEHLSVEDYAKLNVFPFHDVSGMWQRYRPYHNALSSSPPFPALDNITPRISKPCNVVADDQPLDILANQPYLAIQSLNQPLTLAFHLSSLQESTLSLHRLKMIIADLTNGSQSMNASEMSVLQKSMSCLRIDSRSIVASSLLASTVIRSLDVFGEILVYLKSHMDHEHGDTDVQLHQLWTEIEIIVELTSRQRVSEAYLRAHLQNLESLMTRAMATFQHVLADNLQAPASIFHEWCLGTGKSLQRMWSEWKPMTPSGPSQLKAMEDLHHIATYVESLSHSGTATRIASWRLSIAKLGKDVLENNLSGLTTIADLRTTIENESAAMIVPSNGSHFQATFEAICQFHDVSRITEPSSYPDASFELMNLLADRKVDLHAESHRTDNVPGILYFLASVSGWMSPEPRSSIIFGSNAGNMMCDLYNTQQQPLQRLESLAMELEVAAKTLGTNLVAEDDIVKSVNAALDLWLGSILACHSDIFKVGENEILLPHDVTGSGPYYQIILQRFLEPAYQQLNNLHYNKTDLRLLGAVIFSISMASLHLLVPDKIFDPSLKQVVEREHYLHQVGNLKVKAQGLTIFEQAFTGSNSNLRSQLTEKQIKDLGSEPPPVAVFRPETANLQTVQTEFSNIIKMILQKHPETNILASVPGNFANPEISSTDQRQEYQILLGNISQLVVRLKNASAAFYDMTVPITHVLQSLELGARLVVHSNREQADEESFIASLIDRTALVGGKPHGFLCCANPRLGDTLDSRFHALETKVAVVRAEAQSSSRPIDLLPILDLFYQEWKRHLTNDHNQSMRKSRFYHYRGEDVNDEDPEQGVRALFPGDDANLPFDLPDSQEYDPQAVAIQVAAEIAKLYRQYTQHDLRTLIEKTSDTISCAASRKLAEPGLLTAHALMPAVFLRLDKLIKKSTYMQSEKHVDVYFNSDWPEAKKLQDLVQKIQARFNVIKTVWPEHATPQAILQYASEILKAKLCEPVIRLLTRAEKLHALLNEWESVASREFSAAILSQELTDLIVGWRRLEMLSWSKLLDKEDEKTDREAKSWWFLLYEVIISVPCQLTSEELKDHIVTMLATLDKFLANSPLGQFSSRIELIASFKDLLNSNSFKNTWPRQVCSALENLLRYQGRFESQITKTLSSNRKRLVKNIKEQIQLASWKDRNIVALRESAKKSHGKLFKIVRQYRAVIAQQSSMEIVDASPFRQNAILMPTMVQIGIQQVEKATLNLSRSVLAGFEFSFQLFENSSGLTAGMRRLYSQATSGLDVTKELQSMHLDFVENTTQLRKETLTTSTATHKHLIKESNARKRRYFAETLHVLRKMGIPHNLSTAELTNQASITAVLATTPDLAHDLNSILEAEQYFYGFLDLLSRIRESAHDFSEDLTSSQVNRGVGFAEGLLYTMRKQRERLSPFALNLQAVNRVVSTLERARSEKAQGGNLRQMDSHDKIDECKVLSVVLWVPKILLLGASILEIQQKYSGVDLNTVIEKLKASAEAIADFEEYFRNSSGTMTERLRSDKYFENIATVQASLRSLTLDLEQAASSEPCIAYLTQQLLVWIDVESYPARNIDLLSIEDSKQANNISLDSSTINQKICDTSKSILVTIQQLGALHSTNAESLEETRWFKTAEEHCVRCLNSVHIDRIATDLESIVKKLDKIHEATLHESIAVCLLVLPMLQQYCNICTSLFERYVTLHRETCQLSFELVRVFAQVVKEGFCGPSEGRAAQAEDNAKLENGTGLGEGEGAQDISKDVGDDEDLAEFANRENPDQEQTEEIEGTENAIDMGREDLEGDMDQIGESREEDRGEDEGEVEDNTDDIEEEAGHVDDLDPSAVDEKLWDGLAKDRDQNLESHKAAGEALSQQANQQPNDEEVQHDDEAGNSTQAEGGRSEEGTSDIEDEMRDQDKADQIDPHLQQEEATDLPEDMQLDGGKKEGEESLSDDLDDLSDGLEDEGAEFTSNPNGSVADEEDVSMLDDQTGNMTDDDHSVDDADTSQHSENLSKQPGNQSEAAEPVMDVEGDAMGPAGEAGPAEERETEQALTSNSGQQVPGSTERFDQEEKPGSGKSTTQRPENDQAAPGRIEEALPPSEPEVIRKLGDIFERWHEREKDVLERTEEHALNFNEDSEMANVDFEHVQTEDDEGETQALGAALAEQARSLDQTKAIEDGDQQPSEDQLLPEVEHNNQFAPELPSEILSILDQQDQNIKSRHPGMDTLVGDREIPASPQSSPISPSSEPERQSPMDQHNDMPTYSLFSPTSTSTFWSSYSAYTHANALQLQAQLALLLPATTTSKLRGDYRTGKRLNMKRIIPFIASGYRRDKIWLRRSAPSKRNYHVLLAVDDSASMAEGGGRLAGKALETLALVLKALSGLEVGELGVLAFGGSSGTKNQDVRVAHELSAPFTEQAGPNVFGHFGFAGQGTDMRKLVQKSVSMFQEARDRTHGSGTETWQLELIVSDGVFDHHDEVARLVRLAQAERIMFVFVLVDMAGVKKADASANVNTMEEGQKAQTPAHETSILDLKRAMFEPDPETGESKLVMKRYLEGFPFPYYVVVREVSELPGVLCEALRGWFREVGMTEG
ncbi:MAG: hypothetical protein Q9227_007169 [Pyrenula ochraceoflavens]